MRKLEYNLINMSKNTRWALLILFVFLLLYSGRDVLGTELENISENPLLFLLLFSILFLLSRNISGSDEYEWDIGP